MTSAAGSVLLARLSARDFPGLAAEISSFLHPFHPFLSPAAAGRGKSRADPGLLRPLAKQFLPFLSALLKHLAAALPPSFPAPPPDDAAGGLFAAYRLALDCLECLSPCLSGKPYSVHLLRVRLVRCLEGCGMIGEAGREGFAVLESLKSVVPPNPPRARKGKKGDVGRYMPAPSPDGSNEELAFGVAETAVCLIDCVHRSESTDVAAYRRALVLVEQVEPWIR